MRSLCVCLILVLTLGLSACNSDATTGLAPGDAGLTSAGASS